MSKQGVTVHAEGPVGSQRLERYNQFIQSLLQELHDREHEDGCELAVIPYEMKEKIRMFPASLYGDAELNVWATRTCVDRYLNWSGGNPMLTTQRMIATSGWRCGELRKMLSTMSGDLVRSPEVYMDGYDSMGRPIIVIRAADLLDAYPGEPGIRKIVNLLEECMGYSRHAQVSSKIKTKESVSWLVDMHGILGQAFDAQARGMVGQLIKLLRFHYPYHQGKIIIANAPWYYAIAQLIGYFMLDRDVYNSLEWVSGDIEELNKNM
eukprot:Clim_evm32s128 gene=Clim_evmTU32s128